MPSQPHHEAAPRHPHDDWFLVSTGSDCAADVEDPREYREGPSIVFESDIVVKNGKFLKWPEGMQE